MNILIFHLDGALVNLADMRLAAFHRAQNDYVELREAQNVAAIQPRLGDPKWDVVYGSLIFEWTKPLARAAAEIYPGIILGGTGWDFEGGVQIHNTQLPLEVEAMSPDYSVYRRTSDLRDGRAASVGFTQRGCRLRCDFCVVPRKEGKIRPVATLADIWRGDPWPRQIVLLDNDFFGNPHWREILAEARAGDFEISLIQGINARMLDDETAEALASVKIKDDNFNRRRVYTAWDGRKDERRLFRGLEALVRAGFSPDMLMVYMLIGHEPGETHADRDYRRARLRAFGARPYPMPFVRDGELGEELRAFKVWCIQRKDELVPWEKWWGVRGNVRKLGTRRVSLPLFEDAS